MIPDWIGELDDEEWDDYTEKQRDFDRALFMSQALNFIMHNPNAFDAMRENPPWNQPEFQDVNWHNLRGWNFTKTGVQLIMKE